MNRLLVFIVAIAIALAAGLHGDPVNASDVCPAYSSGKIDTVGDPATVEYQVPAGQEAYAYCVKAGPGYEIVWLNPTVFGPNILVIDHPYKDSVSHFSVKLRDYTPPTTTTTSTTTTTTSTTVPPDTTTTTTTTAPDTTTSTTTTEPETTTSTTTTEPQTTTTVRPTTTSTEPPTTVTDPPTTVTEPPTTTAVAPTTTLATFIEIIDPPTTPQPQPTPTSLLAAVRPPNRKR